MKPIEKPRDKGLRGIRTTQSGNTCANRIHITFVSDKERELYRIPTYEYLLP